MKIAISTIWGKNLNHWIFVIGSPRSGREVFENRIEFKRLMKRNKCWGLGGRTPNLKKINVGDKGIFYLAGKNGKCFVAQFEVAAEPRAISKIDKERVDPILTSWCIYLIDLKNIVFFEKYVKIELIKNKLELTRNVSFWGTVFQGGIRGVTKRDFNYILKSSRK